MESYQSFLELERRKRHCDIQKRSYRRRQLRLTELEKRVQALMWENRHLQNQGYRAPLIPRSEHVLPPSRHPMAVTQSQSIIPQVNMDGGQVHPFFNRMASPDAGETPYFLPELDAIKQLSQRSGSELSHRNKEISSVSPVMRTQLGSRSSLTESAHEKESRRMVPQKRPYSAESFYNDNRLVAHRNTPISEPRPKRQELQKEISMNLPVTVSHELDAMKKMYSSDNNQDSKVTIKKEPGEMIGACTVKQQGNYSTDQPTPDKISPCHDPCIPASERVQTSCITTDASVLQRMHAACDSLNVRSVMSPSSFFGGPQQTNQDVDMAIILSEIHQLRNMVSHLQDSVDRISDRLGPEKCPTKQSSDWVARCECRKL